MSLITTFSATPSRLRGIFRFLVKADEHRFDLQSMARMLMPDAFIDSEKDRPRVAFEDTFAEGRYLGLFQVTDEEDVSMAMLHPTIVEKGYVVEDVDQVFPDIIRSRVFEGEDQQTDGVGYTLAWFLSRSPYEAPKNAETSLREIVRVDCRDLTTITNKARYNQAVYWTLYLGFAWEHAIGRDSVLVADPTAYIRRHLPQLFDRTGEEVALPNFMQVLADRAPVFEGGRFREGIEEKVGCREPNHLSESTAFALSRLEEEGHIELTMSSDATALNLPTAGNVRRFSHISWLGD